MGRGSTRKNDATKKNAGKGKQSDNCADGSCSSCGGCFALLMSKMETFTERNEKQAKRIEAYKAEATKIEGYKAEVVAWKNRAGKLTEERNELDMKLTNSSKKKQNAGVERWHVRYLTGEDAAAQEVVNCVMKDCVFPYQKFLPIGWEVYDRSSEDSICSMIMGAVVKPGDLSDEDYWAKLKRPANYKVGTLKQQARKKIQNTLEGKIAVGSCS